MKKFTISLEDEQYRDFKIYCLDHDLSMVEALRMLIDHMFEENLTLSKSE